MESLYLYLPVAHTSINIPLILALGIGIGLLSGIFGVGGGFLITPLLMMMGVSPTVAAATGANQMVAASASGAYTHWKLGNVDIKMGLYLLVGGFVGGIIGVQAIKLLKLLGNADFVIKLTYIFMPGIFGGFMLIESIRSMGKNKQYREENFVSNGENASWISSYLNRLPFQTMFDKSGVQHSILLPLIIGFLVGILAAIMGVGGGFIMIPIMLYLLKMPIHIIVGTSLFQILFTVIEVTFLQAYTNHSVDFVLALIMLISSVPSVQLGAIISKKINSERLKILLALIILSVSVKITLELLINPGVHLTYGGGY